MMAPDLETSHPLPPITDADDNPSTYRTRRSSRHIEDLRIRKSSTVPHPAEFPMVSVNLYPTQFYPFGQQDNVTYDVLELYRLLENNGPLKDCNPAKSEDTDCKRRRRRTSELRSENEERVRALQTEAKFKANPGAQMIARLPTNEVFLPWEVAPLWRGCRPCVAPWIANIDEDFTNRRWRDHRTRMRVQRQNSESLSTELSEPEVDLIKKYVQLFPKGDTTLRLALASIICRSYRSVSRLWKEIPPPSASTTMSLPSRNRSDSDTTRSLEEQLVQLEELLISRHVRCDPLDGSLQAHFDAFVAQSSRPDPLDVSQIARLVLATQESVENELSSLRRRCRQLVDGRITAEGSVAPLDPVPVGPAAKLDNIVQERSPRYIPIHRNIFTDSAPEPDSEALYGCHCPDGVCSPTTCACVLEGGRTYSPDGSLNYNGIGHVVECNHKCACDPKTCRNRVIQKAVKGPTPYPLQIVSTPRCGFGVRAVEPIPAGKFVGEYLGQIISESEAQRLQKEVYFPLGLNYIWTDSFELPNGESAFSIDASTHGNICRFVNHSCDPNLFSCRIERRYRDPRVPQVVFFTRRAIKAAEELTLDYNFDATKKEEECKCGAKKCRKWLR
uniref:Histone-lysine N-methyltransferase n=1 Tax=Spongospora subterranea TaxID=70186 RepID=A0A0H5RNY8_9EUKA|eukprot:CRZ10429.1 hypothetical protein [Spongospora subterranea]